MNGKVEQGFDDGEILMEKKKVFIYNVPVNTIQNSGYHRASDWNVSNPSGTCTLIMSAAGDCCHIQLTDDSGHVFGKSVVALYPDRCGDLSALNPVSDSSRYFTLKLQQYSGVNELIGLGFISHKDSTDITKTLENFFASRNQLSATVPVEESVAEVKVKTRIKTEIGENKFDNKLPSVMVKLEKDHKKEEKSINLIVESTGSGHSSQVKCEVVEEIECSPVISSTREQYSTVTETMHRDSGADCAELLLGTAQGQVQLTPELQQATSSSTAEPEQLSSYVTDKNVSTVSTETSGGPRRKQSILKRKKKKKGASTGLKRPKVFECLVCPVNFTYSILQKKLIIKHLTKFHRIEKSKICRICLLSFESEDEIKEHQELFHNFLCSHCSMAFTSSKKLKTHLNNTVHEETLIYYSDSSNGDSGELSSDVSWLDEDEIHSLTESGSGPEQSTIRTTAKPHQTLLNNNDSSDITTENSIERAQEEDTSWVLTKKLGLVDITGNTEDNEDTILTFRYHAPGYGFKCHLCPLIIKYSALQSRIPIFKHWVEAHGFINPYVCRPCCFLFYSKRQVVEPNPLYIVRCIQCSSVLDGMEMPNEFLKHMYTINENNTLESHYDICNPTLFTETFESAKDPTAASELDHELVAVDTDAVVSIQDNSQDTNHRNKIIRTVKRSIRIQNIELRKHRSNCYTINNSELDLDIDISGANQVDITTLAPAAMDTDQPHFTDPIIPVMNMDVVNPGSDPITPHSDSITLVSDQINSYRDITSYHECVNNAGIRRPRFANNLEEAERTKNISDIVASNIGYRYHHPGDVLQCHWCPEIITKTNALHHWRHFHGKVYSFRCRQCFLVFKNETKLEQHNEIMHSYKCPHCPVTFKNVNQVLYHLFVVHDDI